MKFLLKSRLINLEFRNVLMGLLLVDLFLLFLHLLFFTRYSGGTMFNLEFDRGYGEWFQYIKEALICCLLFLLYFRSKAKVFGAWAFLVLYLLIDDSFQIHEKVGDILGPLVPQSVADLLRVTPHAVGEFLFLSLVGLFLITPVFLFYLKSSNQDRRASVHLFIILSILSFFGIFIDLLHAGLSGFGASLSVVKLFGGIEDGGELLVMSVMLWYVCLLWGRTKVSFNENSPGIVQ